MMDLIFKLAIAHFIGDVALQSEDLVRLKQTSLFFLTAHSFIYGGIIYLVLGQNVVIGLIAVISHWIIDWFKIKKFINLTMDQILHFLFLFLMGAML